MTRKRSRRAAVEGFQVGPETCVDLSYRLFDGDSEPLSEDWEKTSAIIGFGQIPPGVEQALLGCREGDVRSVTLSDQEAFGERAVDAVIEVERDEFPADATEGDRFVADSEAGGSVILTLLEVHEDHVVVDTNHPLAGQSVQVELRVDAVRPARAEEIETAAHALLEADESPPNQLISPERLLQGPSRRYHSDHPNPAGPGPSGSQPPESED